MITWPAAPRAARGRSARTVPPAVVPVETPSPAPPSFELDTIVSHWQRALDTADRALAPDVRALPPAELGRRRRELALERGRTAELIAAAAHVARIEPAPWLAPVPVTATMLGLRTGVRACLFDVEGVLTDSALLHAWVWGEVFDDVLLRLSHVTGWHFIPFDRVSDYRTYVEGRSRVEGIHAFLASRGIHLPEGRFDDPADAGTAFGLARRKGDALARGLRKRGVTALGGARRYLEATGHAGLGRAVISASASTLPMLELAGLSTLVEERVDADVIRVEGLRSRPAPDLLLVACRRLAVRPEDAVTFTHTAAGVAAGHAAGLAVIGVGEGAHADLLEGFGAERVVPSVAVLLDKRLEGSTAVR